MIRRAALPLVRSILFLGLVGAVPVLASEGALDPATTEDEAQLEAPAAPTAEAGLCTEPQTVIEEEPALDRVEQSLCCLDECFRDKDCDSVCAPFGGECMEVNSCCRECFCFG